MRFIDKKPIEISVLDLTFAMNKTNSQYVDNDLADGVSQPGMGQIRYTHAQRVNRQIFSNL